MKVSSITLAVLISATPSGSITAEPPALKKCQLCHGKNLEGKKKNPPIVGMTYESLLASITTNVPKKMKRIAAKLSNQEKEEISKYISTLEGGAVEELE